ncbi:MAG: hypothetical protein QW727_00095 [Candidatus Pacearchaeota archaeon]
MYKKGLSNLIANILIILLSISLIVIISTSLFKLINNPSLSPEQSCLTFLSKKPILIKNLCHNEESKEIEVLIQRTFEKIEIDSINFVIGKEKYFCGNYCSNCEILSYGELKKYYLPFNENKDKMSLIVNNCLIEEIEIKKC